MIVIRTGRNDSFTPPEIVQKVEVGYAALRTNRIKLVIRNEAGYVDISMDPEDAQDLAAELSRFVANAMENDNS
jgi:hypothetical protein